MKHCRADYQAAIVDIRGENARPVGLALEAGEGPAGTPIPKDEPVFLLRAQDPLAAKVVRFYASIAEAEARDGADMAFCALARRHAAMMDAWPVKKVFPDAPGINGPEVGLAPASAAPVDPPSDDHMGPCSGPGTPLSGPMGAPVEEAPDPPSEADVNPGGGQ